MSNRLKDIHTGLFYGSDTGNTEAVTQDLLKLWNLTPVTDIAAGMMTVEDYNKFDFIILGLSTWYDGDLQSDFENFFDEFKTIDFTNKIVAMYGLGDQYGYGRYFIDGLGILGEVIEQNGGKLIGLWPCADYDYEESKAQYNDELFYGLALDDDNEMHKTPERLQLWLDQISKELQENLHVIKSPVSV